MHFTIIVGIGIVLFTGLPSMVAVFFIPVKTYLDLKAHRKEHKKDAPSHTKRY